MFNTRKRELEFLSEVTLRLIDLNNTQAETVASCFGDDVADVDGVLDNSHPYANVAMAAPCRSAVRMTGEWVIYTLDSTPLHVVGGWLDRAENDPQFDETYNRAPVHILDDDTLQVLLKAPEDGEIQRILIPMSRVTYIDERLAPPAPPEPEPERWVEAGHA